MQVYVFFFLLYDPCRIFFLLLTHTMTWALSWPKNSTVKCCTSIAGVRVQVPFIKLKTGRIIHLKDYYYWSGETNIIIKPKLIVSFDFVPKSGKFGGVESAHELKHFFGTSHCFLCLHFRTDWNSWRWGAKCQDGWNHWTFTCSRIFQGKDKRVVTIW